MNYELAKKLKDAGFTQFGSNEDGYATTDAGDMIYIPHLHELIEACGNSFFSLSVSLNGDIWYAFGDWEWQLGEEPKQAKDMRLGHGSTPEEAVANLYLALNNK